MSVEVSLHVLRERLDVDQGNSFGDLRLHPHSSLYMGQDYSVFRQFMDMPALRDSDLPSDVGHPSIPTHRLPRGRTMAMPSTEFGFVREDAYSNPLTWAYAQDLATMEVPEPEYDGFTVSNLNLAVRDYLGTIFGNTAVVIYPH